MLVKEDLTNSLIMIQPIVYAYSFSGPPEVSPLCTLRFGNSLKYLVPVHQLKNNGLIFLIFKGQPEKFLDSA